LYISSLLALSRKVKLAPIGLGEPTMVRRLGAVGAVVGVLSSPALKKRAAVIVWLLLTRSSVDEPPVCSKKCTTMGTATPAWRLTVRSGASPGTAGAPRSIQRSWTWTPLTHTRMPSSLREKKL
jgi:hypothetical protein